MNLDFINKIPANQRIVALVLIVVLIVGGFVYFVYWPKKKQIASLQGEITKIENEININKTKARRLEQLKKENQELERQLILNKEKLPPEAEVASLLKQVSDLGLRVGLDFKLWRPQPKKPNSSGLYTEIPVDVEISGNYHTVATFFDRVSKLPRIVNIDNILMSNPVVDKERVILQTKFQAIAFAAVELTPEEAAKLEKDKQAKEKKQGKPGPTQPAKHGPPAL
jgi:type IV pilus assembly protein PilO